MRVLPVLRTVPEVFRDVLSVVRVPGAEIDIQQVVVEVELLVNPQVEQVIRRVALTVDTGLVDDPVEDDK